jgi:hypothetical protein
MVRWASHDPRARYLAGSASSPAAGVHALVALRGLFPERLGTPVEYGELALMLLTLDYLNAEVVRMDGGNRMSPKLADRPAIMLRLTDGGR